MEKLRKILMDDALAEKFYDSKPQWLEEKIGIIYPKLINSYNKLDPNNLNIGKGINEGTGVDTTQSNYFNTNFIDVLGLDKVYSQIYVNGSMYAYNENFEFISSVLAESPNVYTLPENTRYIRLAGNQSLIGTNSLYLYIEEETTYYAYDITRDSVYTDKKISEVETKIENVKDLIDIRQTSNQFVNKINYKTDFIDGIYLDANGNEKSSAKACSSVFMWEIYC